MAQYRQGHNNRVATFPPFSKKGPPPPFINGPTKRNIPSEHAFDPAALKPMSKALWAASVALGHCLTSYRHLSRLKSTSVSPDGMLGGRGYVMGIKDVRQKLFEACEALSAISDTLHDEIMAPHWKPKLAQLDKNDAEDVSRFVGEAQEILENPEDEAEEEIKKIEEANDDDKSKGGDEEESSEMPDGGSVEESEATPPAPVTKEASLLDRSHTEVLAVEDGVVFHDIAVAKVAARFQQGNSSLPVDTLPGPRVDHIGPGEGDGPWGSFNEDEFKPENDAWTADEGGAGSRDESGEDYDYPSSWENDLSREAEWTAVESESAVPNALMDDTPTEAWDFGLGYGAKGQGAGNYANPSGEGNGSKGVWGPQSGLPGTPAQSVGDTTPAIDTALNDTRAQGMLPQDVAWPPARRDEYTGLKDNLVQSEALAWAQSELPDEAKAPVDIDFSAVDTGYVSEDTATPYVRYDYTTRNERPEHQHGRPEDVPWAHDTDPQR